MKRRPHTILTFVAILGAAISAASRGDSFESFEGPETSWQLADADARPLRVLTHERRFADAYAGRGCEYLRLSAGQGTTVYLAHAITPSRIIPELVPSVWLKSDRSGPQFLARVVFPRSIGKDGQPITALLDGDSYTEIGSWRQLRIDNLPQKLQREARNLRTQNNNLDEREAYIDRLVLNVYAGSGEFDVWIDELGLSVFASASVDRITSADSGRPSPSNPNPLASKSIQPDNQPLETSGLQGNILVADGRPIFVRAIEHRGETFAFLQSLGFNAVWLSSPAADAQLDEAARTKIWLIAPPPPATSGAPDIRPAHDRVLAWHLGESLNAQHEDQITATVLSLRQHDPVQQRPHLFHVSHDFSRFRHDQGILVFERSVVGTSFDLGNYGSWLTQVAHHGRVDAPYWAAIQTEFPADLQNQLQHLSGDVPNLLAIEPDQLRALAYEAVARGTRGLWFRSRVRLDRQEPNNKRRALMLHALNRELELIAPWAAAGTFAGEKATNHPHVRVLALQTSSSRLLIVSRLGSEQQYVSSASDQQPVTFTVHGTPFSDQAYAVSPQGIEPIAMQRGGGIQLSLAKPQPISIILLTQDPLAVNYVGRVAAESRNEYTVCQLEGAESLLSETQQIQEQLAKSATADSRQSSRLIQAQSDLRQAKALLESGDTRGAMQSCVRSMNSVKHVRREHWESATLNFPSPVSSPLCCSFSTLPLHNALASHMASATWGVNLLAAGEMEQLEHLLTSGWRQNRATIPQVNMDVRLSIEKPRAGRSSLYLRAWSDDKTPSRIDGHWPITISSAPIPVREGQLVRIHGWAKVPKPLNGSADGLMIFDSQSGPALAERISESQGWREFTLYRVVTSSSEFKLIFAHTGLGDSWIDDVSVGVFERMTR
jgi:hypothetical protein